MSSAIGSTTAIILLKSRSKAHIKTICLDLSFGITCILLLSLVLGCIVHFKNEIANRISYHSSIIVEHFSPTNKVVSSRLIGSNEACQLYDNMEDDVIHPDAQIVWAIKCDLDLAVDGLYVGIDINGHGVYERKLDGCLATQHLLSKQKICRFEWTADSSLLNMAIITLHLYSDNQETISIEYTGNTVCKVHEKGLWNENDEWIPQSCWLPRQSPKFKNHYLYFIGNSHMRNLFRCAADEVSNGKSWKQSQQFASHECTVDHGGSSDELAFLQRNHCLACENLFPVHRQDYWFNSYFDNVKMRFYWNVLWNVPNDIRLHCTNNLNYTTYDKEINCMIKNFDVEQMHYTLGHLGVDLLETYLKYEFENVDMERFLIFNYANNYNTVENAHLIADILSQHPFKGRAYLVVDPHSGPKFDRIIKIFKRNHVRIIDLRSVFDEYESTHPLNPNILPNHINSVCQRLLVKTILANIVNNKY